jgi:FkbM family methyltransferase
VDVGGNEPIHCNNTYLFELNNWSGIAIEPQDKLRVLWSTNRKAECLDYVIGKEDKDVVFVEGGDEEHGLSGVDEFNKVSDKNKHKIVKHQKRLDEILLEKNLISIDFLSIDVEGYEMQVLESVDFEKVDIKVICIENNINFTNIPIIGKYIGGELGNNVIRKFLRKRGYRQVARLMCDDVFIKK